jgi:predicted nucleotide-binding protein
MRIGDKMARGRQAGKKNRTYPPLHLEEGLKVAKAIQDQASGMSVTRLTLAELLDVSPASSNFRDLAAASRLFGLTTGGINADEFGLTQLGEAATGGDEVAQVAAYKQAVLNVEPYRKFFDAFANKRVPTGTAFKEWLTKNAGVSSDRADECMAFILADAETAGFIRPMKGGGKYIDLAGAPRHVADTTDVEDVDEPKAEDEGELEADLKVEKKPLIPMPPPSASEKAKKVFIAHGKTRTPLDQLRKALDQFKVSYAVAVEEPNKGRPISKKVAALMRDECSSGIFIFTADERFLREGKNGDTEEVWRPSENVVFELGAASILYENRIVIFKEKDVEFPTDFSDLGHIPFEKDQLVAEIGSLFAELVGLDILEVRAKG